MSKQKIRKSDFTPETIETMRANNETISVELMMEIISISTGNIKMGYIRSLSVPPVITCDKGLHCYKKCYARRMETRRDATAKAWARNLALYKYYPREYFDALTVATAIDRYFRYNVGGDIVDRRYLVEMDNTAGINADTDYLAFTKKYALVNQYLDTHAKHDNLHLLFSVDFEQPEPYNPHNLPLVHVVKKGEKIPAGWKVCGGNCTSCICAGVGCWQLKAGDHIAIIEH